jgi:hypothetical protein
MDSLLVGVARALLMGSCAPSMRTSFAMMSQALENLKLRPGVWEDYNVLLEGCSEFFS